MLFIIDYVIYITSIRKSKIFDLGYLSIFIGKLVVLGHKSLTLFIANLT